MTEDQTSSSSPTSAALRTVSIVSSIGAVLTCLLAAGVLLLLPLRFREIFEDFDAELPWLTVQIMGWPGKVLGGVCVLAAVLSVVAAAKVRDLRLGVMIDILVGMAGMLAVIVTALALFLPLVRLIHSIP